LDSEESERLSNSETNEEKMPSDDPRNNVKLDENESFV
jgi:hypothetical protein